MKEMFDWHCVDVRNWRSTRTQQLGAVHNRRALTATKTQFRFLFYPSPRLCHRFRAHRSHQVKYLPRMDCAAGRRSPAERLQSHRKKSGPLAREAPRHCGRLRPMCRCTADNDPAARGRTAHSCPADDPTSQTEMSATVVVVAVAAAVVVLVVLVVAGAVAAGTGNQPQAVEDRSPKTDYHRLSQHPCKPLADSG